ncbi:MAG: YggS family pyridoxal phosphate-dependent enzyme [Oscillospiraceae bacterium]|nr:YggS family pyridoxal phosphate-dependent enzyme [Oscillospiraceae bacterium]
MIRSQLPECPEGQRTGIALRLTEIRRVIASEAAKAGRSPDQIRLMAVTKTVDPGRVNEALSGGADLLGENRAQELREKFQFYSCGREKIHFIGHLQTNKIRDIMKRAACVESVDSVYLAQALETACREENLRLSVFLQVNIGREPQKSGFLPEELPDAAKAVAQLEHLSLQGLMAIPPRGSGERYLREMAELQRTMQQAALPGADFTELSMGMSEDYGAAVRCGATIVRIGRAIFGERG